MGDEQRNSYGQDEAILIGPTLKQARQDLGLAFEDVEHATNIRRRYLEAMERGDYEALPGAVYAQGFLKTYANYLNLDGDELSRELKNQWEAHRGQPVGGGPAGGETPTRRSPGTVPRSTRNRRSRSRRRPFPLAAVGGLALAILVVVIGVGGLYSVGQRAMQSSSGPDPDAPANPGPENPGANVGQTTDESPEDEASKPGGSAGNTTDNTGDGRAPGGEDPGATAPPGPEQLTVTVRVDGNVSWLNIQTDGSVAYEQVAEPGFTQTFEAEQKITVWSGNAGAVFLEVNGQDYGPLGESGETKLQDFELKAAEGRR